MRPLSILLLSLALAATVLCEVEIVPATGKTFEEAKAALQTKLKDLQATFTEKKNQFATKLADLKTKMDQMKLEKEAAKQAQTAVKTAEVKAVATNTETQTVDLKEKFSGVWDKLTQKIKEIKDQQTKAKEAKAANSANMDLTAKRNDLQKEYEDFEKNVDVVLKTVKVAEEDAQTDFAAKLEQLKANFEDWKTQKTLEKEEQQKARNATVEKIKGTVMDTLTKVKEHFQKKKDEAAAASGGTEVGTLEKGISQWIADQSSASGWQSTVWVLLGICGVMAAGLVVLILKQVKTRAEYQPLRGNEQTVFVPTATPINNQERVNLF